MWCTSRRRAGYKISHASYDFFTYLSLRNLQNHNLLMANFLYGRRPGTPAGTQSLDDCKGDDRIPSFVAAKTFPA